MNKIALPADIRALSIRQPWCHHILYDGKDVENRSWCTDFRGLVLIHASMGIDREDRDEVRSKAMPLGGIVGVMRITNCVTRMDSPWFFGPYGLVIAEARPLRFVPCKGTITPKFFLPAINISDLQLA